MQRSEMTHPNFIICPLTNQIYNEPVTIAPSGHVYEWEWLMQVIERAKAEGRPALCPETRQPILGYVKMFRIASAVEEYLLQHPEAKVDQYKKSNPENHLPCVPVIIDQTQKAIVTPSREISAEDRVAIEAAQAELNRMPVHQRREANQPFNPRDEEEFWRVLREQARNEARQEEARQLQRVEEQRRQEQERARQLRQRLENERERAARNKELRGDDEKNRKTLINDIQNLIFALKFESGPLPKGTIDNFSLLFFALIEQAFLEPLPWQKIVVKTGPINREAMYSVLKAAITALTQLDPEVLNRERAKHKGEFDKVKTVFGGECSYGNSKYVLFANAMGTVKNQPGYLINEILKRVDAMLEELQPKYQQRY